VHCATAALAAFVARESGRTVSCGNSAADTPVDNRPPRHTTAIPDINLESPGVKFIKIFPIMKPSFDKIGYPSFLSGCRLSCSTRAIVNIFRSFVHHLLSGSSRFQHIHDRRESLVASMLERADVFPNRQIDVCTGLDE
jgi:hypothetical protein